MGWKEFFKPNLTKIIILLVIIISAIIFEYYTSYNLSIISFTDIHTGKEILSDYTKSTIVTQWFIFPSLLLYLYPYWPSIPPYIMISVDLIYWYILSCLFVLIYSRYHR